jgi:hypothetical protein
MQTYTRLCQAGDKKDGKLYLDGKTIGSLSYGDPKVYLRASECHRKTSSVGEEVVAEAEWFFVSFLRWESDPRPSIAVVSEFLLSLSLSLGFSFFLCHVRSCAFFSLLFSKLGPKG